MTSPAISQAKPSSPVINFAAAATAPSASTAELADHPDALDPVFGKVPAGFELKNQPMPMLVYWLKRAKARIDEVTKVQRQRANTPKPRWLLQWTASMRFSMSL